MADLSDPAALGSDFSSQATTSRSTSTYDASLSAIEVATLTGVDHRAKNRPIAASRQPLLQAVASQFSTFQISTPQATTSRFTSTQELPPSTSLSHNLASKDTSIGGGSPHSPSPHMPYNNTAIPPPDEVTGSAALPLARVKRILQLDEDISACSANGAFVITVATEMFIRYLAEQSLNVVKSERKPRRNIQYKDVANAVARIDNLEFLSDVVPKTTTYREFKKQKAARAARKQEMLQDGQTTLDGAKPAPQSNVDMVDPEDGDPEQQLEQTEGQVNGHESSASHSTSPQTNGSGRTELQHFQTNGESHVDEPKDVEMG